MLMTGPARARDEGGVVAVIVALCCTALLVVAALVVDIAQARLDRQASKSASDASVMAGLKFADGGTDDIFTKRAVCGALSFLRSNEPGLSGLPVGLCSGAWEADTTICDPASPASALTDYTATVTSGGVEYTVQIKSPYSVTEGSFPEESYATLAGDTSAMNGCDQLGVIITKARDPMFGAVVSNDPLTTTIRSVGRITLEPPESPFALLILERDHCLALANTSNGSIRVHGYDTHAGMIHIDSDGLKSDGTLGDQCSSKPLIQGAKVDGIVAEEAPVGGAPGGISHVQPGTGVTVSDGLANVWSGPDPPKAGPFASNQVTREVLDIVYLEGVTDAVSHAKSVFASAASGAPAGYTTVTGCGSLPAPAVTSTVAGPVYVDCQPHRDVNLPNATDVIFKANINNSVIQLPKARNVYVPGTNPTGISVGSEFSINNNGLATCPTSHDPSASRARLFVKTGALKATGGNFIACNTTVILMGGDSDGGACLPSNSPYAVTYTNTPCPGTTSGNGSLDLGGGAVVEWTAPNLVADEIRADPSEHKLLEDLALWTETYGAHGIGGGGYMHLAGVFVAPNAAPMKLNGGPTQDVKNSQYVVRQLWSTGNGALNMQPSPSLPVAPPNLKYSLVR